MLAHRLFCGRFAVHRLGLASAGTGFASETIRVCVCVCSCHYTSVKMTFAECVRYLARLKTGGDSVSWVYSRMMMHR